MRAAYSPNLSLPTALGNEPEIEIATMLIRFDRLITTLAALAAGVVTLATVTPTSARAQAADSIHACYVPLSGTIYRIRAEKAPEGCTRPEHVAFSLTGRSAKGPGGGGSTGGSGGTTTDHGSLAGLLDDDHPQYLRADGARTTTNGFAVAGTLGTGAIPATGAGSRFMWYPAKGALRAGTVDGTQWDDANIGSRSTAFGNNVRASGPFSLASGDSAVASGDFSVAIGRNVTASGYSGIALGTANTASGLASIVIGSKGSTASGPESMVLGANSIASGALATTIGYNNRAVGTWSIALGTLNLATGDRSLALGSNASASGQGAITMGHTSEASGYFSMALGRGAYTNGKAHAVVISAATEDTPISAQIDGHFVMRGARFYMGNNSTATATAGRFIETSTGAYLSSGGAWVSSSDSTKKHHWQNVDGENVLAKLAAIPVRTWSYREEPDSVRHMGPTAQEFRAAFGLGDTDKAIATVDADGVNFAAAQALERRTRVLQNEIVALRAELAALRAELAAARR